MLATKHFEPSRLASLRVVKRQHVKWRGEYYPSVPAGATLGVAAAIASAAAAASSAAAASDVVNAPSSDPGAGAVAAGGGEHRCPRLVGLGRLLPRHRREARGERGEAEGGGRDEAAAPRGCNAFAMSKLEAAVSPSGRAGLAGGDGEK